MKPFRLKHLIQILDEYDQKPLPIDVHLRKYFRNHKAIGSKDRSVICEKIYLLIRWKGLVDQFCQKPVTWQKRIDTLSTLDLIKESSNETLPPHVSLSFPRYLYERILATYGREKSREICLSLNQPAPTTVRINPLKTSRDSVLRAWENEYDISPCTRSQLGITFHKKINFFATPEFKKGYFEIQDEASQIVSDLINPNPGDKVLDFCAGSGGKSLGFAHKLQKKGHIFLHDVRETAISEAKKRLARAGIQNAGCYLGTKSLHRLQGKMDWVLVDAPCSGTGTLRRNPDQKWKFSENMLEELLLKQRNIFEKAVHYLIPGGTIVYATCSILSEENENQVKYFIEKYNLRLVEPPFYSIPSPGKMDGFYAASMKRI